MTVESKKEEKKENLLPLPEEPTLGEKKPFINIDDSFEALLRTYEHCQQWIILADTKAGLTLTIHGVVTGFLVQYIPQIQKAFSKMQGWELGILFFFFGVYFLFQIISFFYTVQIFFPRQLQVDYQATRHIFPVGLASVFPSPEHRQRYWDEYKTLSEEDLKREYAMQYHTDALICNFKYKSLRKALITLFGALFFGFLAFVSIHLFVLKYLS